MFEAALDILQNKVPLMAKRNLTKAKCNCKACGGKDTVIISRAARPGPRGEIVRWHCTSQGCNNRGMT